MVLATGNRWNPIGTERKEAEKSLKPTGNQRKVTQYESNILTGNFSVFQVCGGVSQAAMIMISSLLEDSSDGLDAALVQMIEDGCGGKLIV